MRRTGPKGSSAANTSSSKQNAGYRLPPIHTRVNKGIKRAGRTTLALLMRFAALKFGRFQTPLLSRTQTVAYSPVRQDSSGITLRKSTVSSPLAFTLWCVSPWKLISDPSDPLDTPQPRTWVKVPPNSLESNVVLSAYCPVQVEPVPSMGTARMSPNAANFLGISP